MLPKFRKNYEVLNFPETICMTGDWYHKFYGQKIFSILETTSRKMEEYKQVVTQSNIA